MPGGGSSSRFQRHGSEVYKDYPSVPSWVINALPEKWRYRVLKGEAFIVRDPNPKKGWMICLNVSKGIRCYKIFTKYDTVLYRLVALLEVFKCLSIHEIAYMLGVPYTYANSYVQHYKSAGILEKDGVCYKINTEHPQYEMIKEELSRRDDIWAKINPLLKERVVYTTSITTTTLSSRPQKSASDTLAEEYQKVNSFKEEYTTRLLFVEREQKRKEESEREQTGSSVSKPKKNFRSIEEVLEIARSLLGEEFDDDVRRVIEAFYRVAAESSSVYVSVPRRGDRYEALRTALGLEDIPYRDFVMIVELLEQKRIIWCNDYGRYHKCRLNRDILEKR